MGYSYGIFCTVVMNELVICSNMDEFQYHGVELWGNKSQKNMCSKIPFILSLKTCKIKEYIV